MAAPSGWVDEDVSFTTDGLTLYGTYRHRDGAAPGPAALLISESGNTDRNGDNAVAGPVGNMRQLAQWFATGKIRPAITERVPLAHAIDAIARIANRQVKGKVVILPEA